MKALRQQQEDDFKTGIIVANIYLSLHKDAEGFLDDVELDRVTLIKRNVAKVDELFTILLTKENRDFDSFCPIVEKVNAARGQTI